MPQIRSILVGVKQIFLFYLQPIDIFSDPIITQGLKVTRFTNQEAKDHLREINSSSTVPFTLDQLDQLRLLNWNDSWDRENMDLKGIYLAIAICFDSGRRVGNITLKDGQYKEDHCLRCKDVKFYVRDNSIPIVAGTEFRNYFQHHHLQLEDISQINLYFVTSKTTTSNINLLPTRPCTLLRRTQHESQLVSDITLWVIHSGVMEEDEFLCRYANGRRKVTTRKSVNDAIKFVAELNGINPERVSSKSLRKGLATNGTICSTNSTILKERGGWDPTSTIMENHYVIGPKNQGILSISDNLPLTAQNIHRIM